MRHERRRQRHPATWARSGPASRRAATRVLSPDTESTRAATARWWAARTSARVKRRRFAALEHASISLGTRRAERASRASRCRASRLRQGASEANRSGVREQRDDLSRHSDKPIRIRQPDALDSMVWIVGPRLHARDGAQEAGHGLDVAGPSTRAEGARGGARAGRRADGGPSMERRRRRRGSLEANPHQRQRMLCQQCIASGVRVARERGRRRHGTCIALTLERQGRRRAGCTRTRADTREHVGRWLDHQCNLLSPRQ